MKLWFEARFERLKADQADIRADFAELRRDLFHESGGHEVADYTLYGSLDRRLRPVRRSSLSWHTVRPCSPYLLPGTQCVTYRCSTSVRRHESLCMCRHGSSVRGELLLA